MNQSDLPAVPDTKEDSITVPVVSERFSVEKKTVETGRINIRKQVQVHEEIVDAPLLQEQVTVEHVIVNRLCEGPPPETRTEGETLIIPILEEVLVVEKRLVLKEELHVRRHKTTFHSRQSIKLRREEIMVEHEQALEAPEKE